MARSYDFTKRLQQKLEEHQHEFSTDQVRYEIHDGKYLKHFLIGALTLFASLGCTAGSIVAMGFHAYTLGWALSLIAVAFALIYRNYPIDFESEEDSSEDCQNPAEPGTNPIPPTPANMHVYLKCIAAACERGAQDHIYLSARQWDDLLYRIESYRQRFDQLVAINEVHDCESVVGAFEFIESKIAQEVQQTINILIGRGGHAFEKRTKEVETDIEDLCRALEIDLKTITKTINNGEDLDHSSLFVFFLSDAYKSKDDEDDDKDEPTHAETFHGHLQAIEVAPDSPDTP